MNEQRIAHDYGVVQDLLHSGQWEGDLHARLLEGELFAFHVNSDRPGEPPYLVRLDEHMNRLGTEANGCCSCEDFTIRCFPNFRTNGGEICSRHNSNDKTRTRCKHIELALREFARRVVCRLMIRR